MNKQEYVNRVIANAFDFLETAISEFKEKPKYSIIHFSSAIELVLKARLMHEHWSLIVVGEPDILRFKSGDFQSDNFIKLIPKIEKVFAKKLPKNAEGCFKEIAKHRNKMVHFFHEATTQEASDGMITAVAIEQIKGWLFLKELFKQWDDIFGQYKDQIDNFDAQMKGHHLYLRAVFERIKPEIDKERREGCTFIECSSCQFKASKEEPLTNILSNYKCKVCLFEELAINVSCPSCEEICFMREGHGRDTCHKCSHSFSQEELGSVDIWA